MPLSRNAKGYRRRNALISSPAALVGGIVIVVAVILFALQFFVPGILTSIAAPVWQMGSAASDGMGSLSSVFGNAPALTKERDRLLADNQTLQNENRALRGKVADLEKLIGPTQEQHERILAGVLTRPPVSPYDTLVIGAGKAQGVTANALVFGPGNVPIGTVSDVSNSSARVSLFSSGGRITNAWVGDNRVAITLTGRGAGAFDATLPRDSGVAVNSIVYVSGAGAFPIGTVVRIDSNPSSPRETVHIAPYVNLFSVTWVEIGPSYE